MSAQRHPLGQTLAPGGRDEKGHTDEILTRIRIWLACHRIRVKRRGAACDDDRFIGCCDRLNRWNCHDYSPSQDKSGGSTGDGDRPQSVTIEFSSILTCVKSGMTLTGPIDDPKN